MKIVPVNDNIVVRVVVEEKIGGILIADSVEKERPMQGEVVASAVEGFEVGDVVIFAKYAPVEFEHDGEVLLILGGVDVFAKLK